jgi:mono/diheme cytochrome c family protein
MAFKRLMQSAGQWMAWRQGMALAAAVREDAMNGWALAEVSVLTAAVGLSAVGFAGRPAGPEPTSPLIERGRYLANDVAMCVQCHSPRDESGVLIEGQHFIGAPMPVSSPFRGQAWTTKAPHIRGLNFLSESQAIELLCKGIAHTGNPPDPPMPPFRLTREDAQAIYAYLKSLQ